jgi:benzoyl-CoA reductase subunit C
LTENPQCEHCSVQSKVDFYVGMFYRHRMKIEIPEPNPLEENMDIACGDRLKLFYEISANPNNYARRWKEETKNNVIGFFCSYTPEEIILASGALPFRIFNTGNPIILADTHIQAYSCSLVRGALDDALTGRLDFLKGTIFPHTCDSIQRLSDIWRMNMDFDFHIDVVLPAILNTESARVYMVEVLQKFNRELGNALGREISREQIMSSAKTYNRIRKHLRRLHDIRIQNPEILSATDLYTVIKSAMIMDRSTLPALLSELMEHLMETRQVNQHKKEKRIVLAGGFCNMPEIFRTIETSGGIVITDDFCTGTRYYEGIINTDNDIFEAIAERYLKKISCPAKHSGLYSRGEHIVNLAKESQADGVIFLHLKFCDPHAFDYPYIKAMLDKEDIPSLLFEIEDQLPSEGQFRTRCEAFMEML